VNPSDNVNKLTTQGVTTIISQFPYPIDVECYFENAVTISGMYFNRRPISISTHLKVIQFRDYRNISPQLHVKPAAISPYQLISILVRIGQFQYSQIGLSQLL